MYDWKRKGDGGLIKEVTRDGVTWLSFPALEETGLVAHAFSTRRGGVSKGCYSTMNFSFTRGDDPEAVRENYRRMAKALGVDETRMVLTWQTHTINHRPARRDAGDIFCRLRAAVFSGPEKKGHRSGPFGLERDRKPHGPGGSVGHGKGVRHGSG